MNHDVYDMNGVSKLCGEFNLTYTRVSDIHREDQRIVTLVSCFEVISIEHSPSTYLIWTEQCAGAEVRTDAFHYSIQGTDI